MQSKIGLNKSKHLEAGGIYTIPLTHNCVQYSINPYTFVSICFSNKSIFDWASDDIRMDNDFLNHTGIKQVFMFQEDSKDYVQVTIYNFEVLSQVIGLSFANLTSVGVLHLFTSFQLCVRLYLLQESSNFLWFSARSLLSEKFFSCLKGHYISQW